LASINHTSAQQQQQRRRRGQWLEISDVAFENVTTRYFQNDIRYYLSAVCIFSEAADSREDVLAVGVLRTLNCERFFSHKMGDVFLSD